MAMQINGNYGSYAAQGMADSSAASNAKTKEAQSTAEQAESGKSKSTTEYMNELAKLAPSVEFKVGNTYASAKNGLTLTINPKLLEEMQNDPEKEKEMKELIKGVEAMEKLSESLNKATGWTTVFRHSYIDENGQYRHIALTRNDFMLDMSDELREERWQNAEKLLESQKETAAEKKEELQEMLEMKKEEQAEEEAAYNKLQQLFEEKIAASEDGIIHLNDAEFKAILAAIKEDKASKIPLSLAAANSYRKQFLENGMQGANGKVITKEDKEHIIKQAKQATNALSANKYDNALAKEAEKLKNQRMHSGQMHNGQYSLSNKLEDYVRAYGNLYDEIVQGYRNGTRERYVEDETSETGFRKMTMEEELSGLDKAFQKMADRAELEQKITNEFNRLFSKAGNKKAPFKKASLMESYKKLQKTEKDTPKTIGQKMKNLAQAWKDAYRVSGSKECSMEKALSMVHGRFHINNKA